MRSGEHAPDGPGGASAATQVAVAPATLVGDADGSAGQQTGAVWDQPLPWAAQQEGGEDGSTGQPASSQAEPPAPQAEQSAAEANPVPQGAVVRTEGGDDDAKGGAQAADDDASVALWQAAAAEQQRGAHAAPTPIGATAVAGHAVSKWLLGAAVAAGGLLAAVGVSAGASSHQSAATAKDRPLPLVGPGEDLDEAGDLSASPTPSPTPTSLTPAKGRTVMAGAGKAAAPVVGLVAAHAQSEHTTAPTDTPQASSHRLTTKSSMAAQSSYLSVQTAVKSPNAYWSQSQVTVTTTKKLTALKVVLHVAQTGGVADTGVWTSLGDKVTVHTGRQANGAPDYVVTLNEGISLDAGTFVFQFGYNHDNGTRDTVHDIWSVVTTASGDSDEGRTGRF
ncbi:hypothetical protein [Streptomyces canus]|uniref:hypothetical protein n=1 Tax=Streptomyces canus TaxID=58343 RepID=UPI0032568135